MSIRIQLASIPTAATALLAPITAAHASTSALSDCDSGWACVWGYPDYQTLKLNTGTINTDRPLPGTSTGQSAANKTKYHMSLYTNRNCTGQIVELAPGGMTAFTEQSIRCVRLYQL